eukprot:Opistho-2@50861
MKVSGDLHQYQVVGRRLPSDKEPTPQLYRMKIFASNPIIARSRFWYFLTKLRKLRKTQGEIVACQEVFEKRPEKVKNFGVWLRYDSRTGTHNMYKEYRDLSIANAVTACYRDLAARHRVRGRSIQIIKTAEITAEQSRRVSTKQFHDSHIKFPLPHRVLKAKSRFIAKRPNTFF